MAQDHKLRRMRKRNVSGSQKFSEALYSLKRRPGTVGLNQNHSCFQLCNNKNEKLCGTPYELFFDVVLSSNQNGDLYFERCKTSGVPHSTGI